MTSQRVITSFTRLRNVVYADALFMRHETEHAEDQKPSQETRKHVDHSEN